MARVQSFLRASHTATADTKFRLIQSDAWFRDLNIECFTNDAYYGDTNEQDLTLPSGDILAYQGPINLAEIYFKNQNAGSNCKITAAGTLLTPKELRELELED